MNDLIYDAYSIFFQLAQNCAPDYLGTLELQLTVFIFSGVFLLAIVAGLIAVWYCIAKNMLKLGMSE